MIRYVRSISAAIGLALMVVGVGAILAVGVLYAYGEYERVRLGQELANDFEQETPSAVVEDVENGPIEETAPAADVTVDPPVTLRDTGPGDQAIVAELVPRKARPIPRASRVVIPRIRVDSVIREARLQNREWQVPKFVVGHLEGTANPGEKGNVVLSGHLESIASGNVFARLNELDVGDAITLFAGGRELPYQVIETKLVENTDLSVVEPTTEETLTLVTCAGTFNILARDYSHRLIVIATPFEESPPGE